MCVCVYIYMYVLEKRSTRLYTGRIQSMVASRIRLMKGANTFCQFVKLVKRIPT